MRLPNPLVDEIVFKVVHAKGGVETVYLVAATSSRDAVTRVLDSLYERRHPLYWTPEELAYDRFGLMAPTGEWTNRKLCQDHGCSVSATPFLPDPPYRLYALDTKTGGMS